MNTTTAVLAQREQATVRDAGKALRTERIRKIKALDPELTNRDIARRVGCGHDVVRRALGGK